MNEIHTRADLNLFRVLDAIDSTGGIGAAAVQLHLTQSAISHSLKRLRVLLDDPLFIRQGKSMVATTYARSILPTVREHLRGLNACIQTQKNFDPSTLDCTFNFGFRDPAESMVFPRLLPLLNRYAPKLKINSHPITAETLERDLTRGKVDLAADVSISMPRHIQSDVLYRESTVVMFSNKHSCAQDGLDFDTFANARHVVVTPSPNVPSVLEQHLLDHGVKRQIVFRSQQYFAASQIISNSDWLMLVPERFAETMKQLLPVDYCECPVELPKLELRLYWHENMEHDAGIIWVRKVALDYVKRQIDTNNI